MATAPMDVPWPPPLDVPQDQAFQQDVPLATRPDCQIVCDANQTALLYEVQDWTELARVELDLNVSDELAGQPITYALFDCGASHDCIQVADGEGVAPQHLAATRDAPPGHTLRIRVAWSGLLAPVLDGDSALVGSERVEVKGMAHLLRAAMEEQVVPLQNDLVVPGGEAYAAAIWDLAADPAWRLSSIELEVSWTPSDETTRSASASIRCDGCLVHSFIGESPLSLRMDAMLAEAASLWIYPAPIGGRLVPPYLGGTTFHVTGEMHVLLEPQPVGEDLPRQSTDGMGPPAP